jgi:transposase
MGRPTLTEQEIHQRLIRLRNLEQLHAKAKQRIASLEELANLQAAHIQSLEEANEQLKVRVAELEKMVFGRRRGQDGSGGHEPPVTPDSSSKQPRTSDSYRRPTPSDNQVTKTELVTVAGCHSCRGPLVDIQIHLRYVEDILLPALLEQSAKTVTKLEVEQGYCPRCGTYSSGRDLRGQEVVLGPQLRLLVTYLVTLMDLTYAQVTILIQDLYGLAISSGEVAAILATSAKQYLPEYERLKQSIRGGPGVHLDETAWQIQTEGGRNFAWAMASSTTDDVVFHPSDGRGKGNAEALLGKDYTGIRITDCYGAYKNLAGLHQVCWAHLYRVARDLAQLQDLTDEKRVHCQYFYTEFGRLYTTLRAYLNEPFDQQQRASQRDELLVRVDQVSASHPLDPKKLRDLKARLQTYRHALFTCLLHEGIPADNNKAERHLRKLVIKRKKSFGSKTMAGAHNLAVLMSVAWSTWYRDRTRFFPAMMEAATLG